MVHYGQSYYGHEWYSSLPKVTAVVEIRGVREDWNSVSSRLNLTEYMFTN